MRSIKTRTVSAIITAVMAMSIVGCAGHKDLPADEAVVDTADAEVSEEGNEEASVEAPAEESSAEVSEEEVEEEVEEDVAPETDDFNDFVEVDFEPAEYPSVNDENPDYSGIYCQEDFPSTVWAYCKLIKQEDGSYYFDMFAYREAHYEGKASFKSEGLLEINEIDEEGTTGTIAVNEDKVTFSVVNKDNKEKVYVYNAYGFYPKYPNLDKYAGVYTYTTKDGDDVIITVGYDEHREPFVTLETGESQVEFRHSSEDRSIWELEDGIYGNILYAQIEDQCWGPDSEVFSFMQNYGGNKYLVIDNNGDTPKVYYKTYQPEVMH